MKPTCVIFLQITLFILLSTSSASARWATHEDAESEVEFENGDFYVESSGNYTEIIETGIKLLKESARDNLTTRRLVYNSMSTEIKVLEAKTIHHGKSYLVKPEFIEDKPLASSPNGFDQNNQILIAYPEVQPNSEIYLKYQLKTKASPIPGFFSTTFTYGSDAYEKSGTVKITSEIPLYVGMNDPENYLKLKQSESSSKGKKLYHIEIKLKRPVYLEAVDEAGVRIDPKKIPRVDVSTSQDWAQMAQPVLAKYESILNQPLPKPFKKILDAAQEEKNLTHQINIVTSLLASHVNYLGDWRPISGLYVPRDLSVIAETRLGDCKDFSAATASILRKLGHKAHIAWVKRGYTIYESPNSIPTLNEFNHAIVRVDTQGKTLWIDPTNFSSFAQGIFPDIADRKTLVLKADSSELTHIPAISADLSKIELIKNVDIEEQDKLHVSGKLKMEGVTAIPYTGISLKASKQSIDYELIKALGDENRITQWKIENYDLTSRIAEDISFQFKFVEQNSDLRTSAGPAVILSSGSTIPILLTKTQDRVSDLFLGIPISIHREINLTKINRLGNQSLNCSIKSPWVTASREVTDSSTGVKVSDSIIVKKSLIPNSELKSKDYSQLQEQLQKCFNGVAIIYSKGPKRPLIK